MASLTFQEGLFRLELLDRQHIDGLTSVATGTPSMNPLYAKVDLAGAATP